MCTLVVATRAWLDSPLVVLANRDERLDRPAGLPQIWDRKLPVLAPVDREAGGTWWGLNTHGVFAGITNRFTAAADPDSGRRSRGLLVMDALIYESAAAAAAKLGARPGAEHNPFHLVVADRKGAHLIWSDGQRTQREGLDPGWHVLTERAKEAGPTDRLGRVEALVAGLDEDRPPRLQEVAPVLARHADPASEGVCVHADERNYGTRSSTFLRLGRGQDVVLWHADGKPCVTPYADYSPEARRMLVE